jgi:hypothetical protein
MIALPFNSNGYAASTLARIPFDTRASIVAVDHEGEYVSINYPDLRPGDVILFDMDKFDPLFTPMIAVYQSEIFKDSKIARWRHVGILDDNYQVWDAMPGLDVRVRPLREVLSALSRVCVRRPVSPIDVNLLRDSLMQISSKSKYRFNYDTGKGLVSRLRKRGDTTSMTAKAISGDVICSNFVEKVLWRASGKVFFSKLPIVLPADYMVSREFRSVDLHWCCMDRPKSDDSKSSAVQPAV